MGVEMSGTAQGAFGIIFAFELTWPWPRTIPQTTQHPRAGRTLGTIKFKLFVLELRNISPERVTDWCRVSQPFNERDRLTARL